MAYKLHDAREDLAALGALSMMLVPVSFLGYRAIYLSQHPRLLSIVLAFVLLLVGFGWMEQLVHNATRRSPGAASEPAEQRPAAPSRAHVRVVKGPCNRAHTATRSSKTVFDQALLPEHDPRDN